MHQEAGPVRRVLVVDDDAFSRSVVAKRLLKYAQVVEAEDGMAAVARMSEHQFSLAIVDLEMPNFGGLDLIRIIRGLAGHKHIPIVVVTGNESRAAFNDALMAGATSYLLKPLNWHGFGAHITHLLTLGAPIGKAAVEV